MPQGTKGGKWVFDQAIVVPDKDVPIPTKAFQEYRLHQDDPVVFTLGSRRSSGFGLAYRVKVASSIINSLAHNRGRSYQQRNAHFSYTNC
ncbi:MAG: hypothetical protein ABFD29_13720 [Anaerolineaceae bacterium]